MLHEIYWVKAGSHPYWPCLVLDSDKIKIRMRNKAGYKEGKVLIMYFGDHEFSAVKVDSLHKWGEEPLHSEVCDILLIGVLARCKCCY